MDGYNVDSFLDNLFGSPSTLPEEEDKNITNYTDASLDSADEGDDLSQYDLDTFLDNVEPIEMDPFEPAPDLTAPTSPIDTEADKQTEGVEYLELDPRIEAGYDVSIAEADKRFDRRFENVDLEQQMLELARKGFEMQGGNVAAMPVPQLRSVESQYSDAEDSAMGLYTSEVQDIESAAIELQEYLDGSNRTRANLTDYLLDQGLNVKQVRDLVFAAEFVPFYGTYMGAQDIPEYVREIGEAYEQGDYGQVAKYAGFAGLETLGAILPTAALVKKGKRVLEGSPEKQLERARRNNYRGAELATAQTKEESRILAAQKAKENKDIREKLIREFEANLSIGKDDPVTVSKTVAGNLVLDPDKARQVGRETARNAYDSEINRSIKDFLEDNVDVGASEFAHLNTGSDKIFSPILNPDKFDGIVAIAGDYKKQFPDQWNDSKTVIDNLFELTVSKDFKPGQELLDDLNKYGLSFEDYVVSVVGTGSEAGKVLNKLSQIKRARPISVQREAQQKKLTDQQGAIRKGFMRIENVRRGLLVSQIATAARNLTSAGIRAPLESFGNVMDTALYNLSEDGLGAGVRSLVSGQNWKDSFRGMSYMFSRPDVARGYTDLLLKQPELADQFDRMFNNINEIQEMTGRGQATTRTGKAFDTVLTAMEDGTDILNIPNRWQEYLVRRAMFFGEAQRLVRNEYGIDLVDALQNGKLPDLLNDASNVKPEGARSFIDIMDDSVNKSLDVTYAKQPEIPVFRSTASFITRNGLTVAIPFPRFMFNAMELMGQYAGGAAIPLTRKMTELVTMGKVGAGKLTGKDRQRITRNLMGWAAIGAAYQYRTSDQAPAKDNEIYSAEGTVMDTAPQFPMRQFLYLGEAAKRLREGTWDEWFDARTFTEVFTGSNFRGGTGMALLDQVSDLATGTDLVAGEQAGKALGDALGQWVGSWVVPLTQVIETQRVTGQRGLTYKDVREDPTLDFQSSFMSGLTRSMKQRGIGVSPEEEASMPAREFLYQEEAERVNPLRRIIFGMTERKADSAEGQYLTELGFEEYELGSTSKVPSIQRFETKILRESLPEIVKGARMVEEFYGNRYDNGSETLRTTQSKKSYVTNEVKKYVSENVQDVKRMIGEGSKGKASPYIQAMLDFRKLSKRDRKTAMAEFKNMQDRIPFQYEGPLTDEERIKQMTDDMRMLALIGSELK